MIDKEYKDIIYKTIKNQRSLDESTKDLISLFAISEFVSIESVLSNHTTSNQLNPQST